MTIFVIGDVMLDQYIMGSCNRISPEAPVPIVNFLSKKNTLGGAANVAQNIACLGDCVQLFGITGKDNAAKDLINLCSANNIHYEFVSDISEKTIVKQRVIANNFQMLRVDHEQYFADNNRLELLKKIFNSVIEKSFVYISDYGKGTIECTPSLINDFKNKRCRVIIDPKGSDFDKYKGAYLIKPNYKEFTTIVGECRDENEIRAKASKLVNRLNIDNLLITRGARGMTLVSREPRYHNFNHDTAQVEFNEVVDVTGAGDTVGAVLTVCLEMGYNLMDAIRIANDAAKLVVGTLGTSCISPHELNEICERYGLGQKIVR